MTFYKAAVFIPQNSRSTTPRNRGKRRIIARALMHRTPAKVPSPGLAQQPLSADIRGVLDRARTPRKSRNLLNWTGRRRVATSG